MLSASDVSAARGGLARWPGRAALALLVLLTAGYFQNDRPGWGVNSQFALACAIAERGTLSIDAYHARPKTETGDKSIFAGHVYSDKSLVTPLLAAPAVWIYRRVCEVSGGPFSYDAARYLATWSVEGGASAVFAVLLATLLMRRGVRPAWALAGASLWWLATPLLGYSVILMPYLPASALGLGGLLAIEPLWRAPSAPLPGGKRIFAAALLFGLAAWTLNTFALAALLALAVSFAAVLTPENENLLRRVPLARLRRLVRFGIPWLAGGACGVAGYYIYTLTVFHTLKSPYRFEADDFFRTHMAEGFMGSTRPRLIVAWLMTFHPFLGLFVWFPVTLMALAGSVALILRGKRRTGSDLLLQSEASLALWVFLGLLAYFSGYFMWWGGWNYAPRHLIATLPWMGVGLIPWLDARRVAWRWFAIAVAGAGAIFNIAAVALDPQVPPGLPQDVLMKPETVTHWPMPFLALQRYFWIHDQVSPNWGTAMGLQGKTSLVPLVAMWGLAAGVLIFVRRRDVGSVQETEAG